jgi:hypothetical protein
VDFVQAYTFMFKEDRWIPKLVIGGLVVLLSVLILPSFILVGYQIAVVRRVMAGATPILPEWDEIGRKFMDGLNLAIAIVVYALPLWLLACIMVVLSFVFADPATGQVTGLGTIPMIVIGCLMLPFGLALAFAVPALTIQYARVGQLNALFRFREIADLVRENAVDILLTIVASAVAGLALSMVISVSIITICGPIILAFGGPVWQQIGLGHLYGQVGTKVSGKLAPAG